MKNKLLNVFFGLVFIIGLSILLYPIVSDLINSYKQSQVVNLYQEEVNNMSDETYQEALYEAQTYNSYISQYTEISSALAAEKNFPGKTYDELLDIGGIGVMGILKIPVVNIELPIYHGTNQEELQVGVGHYEGSSLPIGGESTHCVLTGHRGLPSSRLLTDIDQLEEGDIFYIQVLKQTIAYEVDQIKTVEPEEVNDINIVQGMDYCTLVTCTPYGINTHRLLVRGKRIAYVDLKGDYDEEILVFPLVFAIFIVVMMYMVVCILKDKLRKRG